MVSLLVISLFGCFHKPQLHNYTLIMEAKKAASCKD